MDARSGFGFFCSPSGALSNHFQTARQTNSSFLPICGTRKDCEPIQDKPDPRRHAQAREAANDRA